MANCLINEAAPSFVNGLFSPRLMHSGDWSQEYFLIIQDFKSKLMWQNSHPEKQKISYQHIRFIPCSYSSEHTGQQTPSFVVGLGQNGLLHTEVIHDISPSKQTHLVQLSLSQLSPEWYRRSLSKSLHMVLVSKPSSRLVFSKMFKFSL